MLLSPVQICSRCDRARRPCAGACACDVDGKDITLHQSRGYCPLAKFGTAEKPDGWDLLPAGPPPPSPPPRASVEIIAARLAVCRSCPGGHLLAEQENDHVCCARGKMCCGGKVDVAVKDLGEGRCLEGHWPELLPPGE